MSDLKATPPRELTCQECRELLSSYLDQELEAQDSQAVELHLRNCGKCGKETTEFKGLKNVVQHWDGIKGSGEWRKAVVERYIRESQMMPSRPFTDAADSVREFANSESENKLPPGLVLGIASMLAVAAYFLIQHFFKS